MNHLRDLSDADRHQDTQVVISLWNLHKEHLELMHSSKLHSFLTSVTDCVGNLVNVPDMCLVMSAYVHYYQRHMEEYLTNLCKRKDVYLPNLVRYMAYLNYKLASFTEYDFIIKTTDKGQPLCQETGE